MVFLKDTFQDSVEITSPAGVPLDCIPDNWDSFSDVTQVQAKPLEYFPEDWDLPLSSQHSQRGNFEANGSPFFLGSVGVSGSAETSKSYLEGNTNCKTIEKENNLSSETNLRPQCPNGSQSSKTLEFCRNDLSTALKPQKRSFNFGTQTSLMSASLPKTPFCPGTPKERFNKPLCGVQPSTRPSYSPLWRTSDPEGSCGPPVSGPSILKSGPSILKSGPSILKSGPSILKSSQRCTKACSGSKLPYSRPNSSSSSSTQPASVKYTFKKTLIQMKPGTSTTNPKNQQPHLKFRFVKKSFENVSLRPPVDKMGPSLPPISNHSNVAWKHPSDLPQRPSFAPKMSLSQPNQSTFGHLTNNYGPSLRPVGTLASRPRAPNLRDSNPVKKYLAVPPLLPISSRPSFSKGPSNGTVHSSSTAGAVTRSGEIFPYFPIFRPQEAGRSPSHSSFQLPGPITVNRDTSTGPLPSRR